MGVGERQSSGRAKERGGWFYPKATCPAVLQAKNISPFWQRLIVLIVLKLAIRLDFMLHQSDLWDHGFTQRGG